MTVRNLNTTTDYATWALAIAGLPAPLVANVILEDQDGATYAEKVSLDSRNMGGFTLTLQRKTGVAKPTISYGADFEAVIRVSNTIGIILDGLITDCGTGTARKGLQVGPDGAGGAAGANTVTAQNCNFVVNTTGAAVDVSSYGAGNTQTVTINDCVFSSTYAQALIITGVAASITLQYNRCSTTGTIGGAGRAWDFTGASDLTATITQLNMNTNLASASSLGTPFTLNAQTRTIIATITNCRFFGLWDSAVTQINSSSGTCTATIRFCTFVNTYLVSGGATTSILKFADASGNDTFNFRDNILTSLAVANSAGVGMLNLSTAAALAATTSDYNVFYLVNATGNNITSQNGTDYTTLAAWQAATVHDDNSKSGSPDFTNIATGNLHISNTSIAAGAGVAIGGVTTDLDGLTRPNPPAIGAYEPLPEGLLSPNDIDLMTIDDEVESSFSTYDTTTGIAPAPVVTGNWWPFQEDVN